MTKPRRQTSVLIKPTAAADPVTAKAIDDLRRAMPAPKLLDEAQRIEDVPLTTTAFARIRHTLGRRPTGYAVVRLKTAPGAAYSIYDDNDNRTDAQQFLYLRTVGANVTVDLVVF